MKSVHSRILVEVLVPEEWSADHLNELGIIDWENPDQGNKIDEAVSQVKAKLAEQLLAISPDIEVR